MDKFDCLNTSCRLQGIIETAIDLPARKDCFEFNREALPSYCWQTTVSEIMNTLDSVESPSWVPPKVVDAARLISGEEDAPTEVVAVVRRLLMDERMKTVWAELNTCQRENYRSTDRKFHFSKLPPEVGSSAALAKTWRERTEENRELGDTVMAKQFEFWSMYSYDTSPLAL